MCKVKLLLIKEVIIIQDLNRCLYLSLMYIGLEIILQVCRYWKSHLCIKILTNKNGKRKTNFQNKNLFFHRSNLEKWVIIPIIIRIIKKKGKKSFYILIIGVEQHIKNNKIINLAFNAKIVQIIKQNRSLRAASLIKQHLH